MGKSATNPARESGKPQRIATRNSHKNQGVTVAEANKSPARPGPLAAAQKLVERATRKDGQGLNETQRESLLRDCEGLIDKHLEGFVAVGTALRIIRDEKLYEELDFENFAVYCQDRWGFGKARASQLISAAGIVEAVYNCKQIARLPSNEAQVRPLVQLDSEQQIDVWKRVVKKAGDDKPITAKLVEETVAKVISKGGEPSKSDAAENASEEESAADRRKRFTSHCDLLKKLEGERLSKKQKVLRGTLQSHASKFLDDVLGLAHKLGDKLSKQGARRASGVVGDEIAVGLLQKLKDALTDRKILDLVAPAEDDNS